MGPDAWRFLCYPVGILSTAYELLEKIGSGGMGEIYRARALDGPMANRIVAVKRVLRHFTMNEERVHMFIDEARILSSLDHPNIVKVHEFIQVDSEHWLILEYVPGHSLSEVLLRNKRIHRLFSVPLIAYIGQELSAALHYAHHKTDESGRRLSIVHRDVSPDNILVSYQGLVKISDFGIAKAERRSCMTRDGVLKGKMGYIAPEQAWGQSADRRSDIFSLGAVLFELLSGHKLFKRDADWTVMVDRVRSFEGLEFLDCPDWIPAPFWRVMVRALHPSPDRRFQEAAEFEAALSGLRGELGWDAGARELSLLMGELFPGEDGELPDQDLRWRSLDHWMAARYEGTEDRPALSDADTCLDSQQPTLTSTTYLIKKLAPQDG